MICDTLILGGDDVIEYVEARNMVLQWIVDKRINEVDGNALLNFIDMIWARSK